MVTEEKPVLRKVTYWDLLKVTASDNRLSAASQAGDNRLSPACEAADNRLKT